ncbi:transposase [Taibaiella helva]|uniref:transposase n=1 Tax=Taibaiella helva TaxID=2301235 RepID=UPI000E56F676|nr:transposase [Taibaiella helva]
MTYLYQNRYRIPSARLSTWNYGNEGMYFVTICTAGRQHYFGDIIIPSVETPCWRLEDKEDSITSEEQDKSILPRQYMQLSALGRIAEEEWYKTVALRKDMCLQTGEFVVMPNHIHGILGIGPNQYNEHVAFNRNRFGPQSHNLASVLRGYKSAVTSYALEHSISFRWQARFHDHIIRSYEEYQRISAYIRNNPENWQKDKFYK